MTMSSHIPSEKYETVHETVELINKYEIIAAADLNKVSSNAAGYEEAAPWKTQVQGGKEHLDEDQHGGSRERRNTGIY
jgi:hypothetical protein